MKVQRNVTKQTQTRYKEKKMITRKELLANPELLADKVRGALCGLAIGDSLGDACRMPENQRD